MIASFDLDSTLCDTSNRQHLINEESIAARDWTAYGLLCDTDTPFMAVVQLVNLYKDAGYEIAYTSGRCEEAREKTLAWSEKYVGFAPDYLLLADLGWDENHDLYKVRRLRELSAHGEVVIHIDDWPTVKKAVEEHLDIPVLVVDPCYSERRLA